MQTQPTTAQRGKPRIFEIDALRGVAILMMCLFHLLFDLSNYFGKDINLYSGVWFWVGRLSAIGFMLISGVAGSLGGRSVRRGLIILAAAMVVTLASIPIMGEYYIRFGILHYFAAVMLLKGLFEKLVKNRAARLATAAALVPVCFGLGSALRGVQVNTFWLLPLGITYPGFASFDYYPLLPWAGWFCLGTAVGLLVYKNKQSLFAFNPAHPGGNLPGRALGLALRPLTFLGRHSLPVYILHQPLILGVLYLLHFAGAL